MFEGPGKSSAPRAIVPKDRVNEETQAAMFPRVFLKRETRKKSR
jgi:hypothetical protein